MQMEKDVSIIQENNGAYCIWTDTVFLNYTMFWK